MDWILYLLLALAAAGDILLAVVLAKVMRKNAGPEQKIDTADDFVRAVTPVLQSETDLLAEQLRAMQGESARTTSATLRDFSAVLAENQRQSAASSTARLEAIDRAGAGGAGLAAFQYAGGQQHSPAHGAVFFHNRGCGQCKKHRAQHAVDDQQCSRHTILPIKSVLL